MKNAQELDTSFQTIWSRWSIQNHLSDFSEKQWVICNFYPEQILSISGKTINTLLFGYQKQKYGHEPFPQRAIAINEDETKLLISYYWAYRYWLIGGVKAIQGVLNNNPDEVRSAIQELMTEFDQRIEQRKSRQTISYSAQNPPTNQQLLLR